MTGAKTKVRKGPTPRAKVQRKLTYRQRLEEVRSFVLLCFSALEADTLQAAADATGLCVPTIRRLQERKFSLRLQVRTLQLLGIAAGMKLEMNPYGYSVELIHDDKNYLTFRKSKRKSRKRREALARQKR